MKIFVEETNMGSLLCIFLFMLVIIIIFYPLHASSTEQPAYNETPNSNTYLNQSSPLDNQSNVITFGLSSFRYRLVKSCHTNFNCTS